MIENLIVVLIFLFIYFTGLFISSPYFYVVCEGVIITGIMYIAGEHGF